MSQEQPTKQPDSGVVQGLAVGGGGTVVGGGLVAAILMPQHHTAILIFLVVALVLALAGLGVFLFLRARRRKAQAAGIEKDMVVAMDRQAASSNDPEIKARLEKMKRKFMLLVDTLRREGHKNIYEMPWFLTLGPSGSGKSWVLEGSGLEPLSDEPWKGGTFLIDWWSCPEALVLDTAGGVVFREERGYESPEWQFLLGLLKRHRPQCPINGLLVMVPAQLLWLRDDELPEGWLTLDDYANALRVQIRKKLQRELGIRFPVYFLVTQSDRLPGFREFADALENNGKPKGQMVGWSIPVEVGKKGVKAPGGAESDPELEEIKVLEQRLGEVASDLRRQRLPLLRKYTGDGARADELGMAVRRRAADLFAFPDAVQNTLAPRLQELLEKVFKPDPMLPKLPPYLRGVYFTSALREGEVLDRQRAGVGRTLASLALPGGADNEQPNPFFLKDLVPGKAFSEAGLVTPLVQAGAYLRQRRRTLLLSGIAAGLVLLVAIAIGGKSYMATVGSELNEWQTARDAVTNKADLSINRYWLPIVKTGDLKDIQLDPDNIGKQLAFANAVTARPSSFWSFRWLFGMGKLDKPRRQAQLHLFERGVIWPLADIARHKMTNEPPQSDQDKLTRQTQQFQGALLALLELQLNTNRTGKGYDWEASRDRVLDGLVNYALAGQKDQATSETTLAQAKTLFDRTYKGQRETWPPDIGLSAEGFTNLLQNAFVCVRQLQSNQTSLLEEAGTRLRGLVTDAASLTQLEQNLVSDIENRESLAMLSERLGNLRTTWDSLAGRLRAEKVQLLVPGFTNFAARMTKTRKEQQQLFRQRVAQVNGAAIGSNLIPILAWGFDRLTEDVPAEADILNRFRDLYPSATMIDATLLSTWAPKGTAPAPGVEPQRLLPQRIDLYSQILNLQVPPTRPCERNLFEDAGNDPKEVLDNFSNTASQSCAAIQMGPCTGLTNGAISYPEVLCQYIEFRFLEKLLQASERATANALEGGDFDVDINMNRNPGAMLNETGVAFGKLKKLDSVWKELKSRWQRLAGRDARLIKRGTELLSDKRISLLEKITNEIEKERDGSGKFPLTAQGEPMSESEIRKYRDRAQRWRNAVQDRASEAKQIPADAFAQWERLINEEWFAKLDRLVDENGDIRDYEVRTPWGEQEDAFKNFLREEGAFKSAKEAAGVYRVWRIAGKPLQADDPKGVVPVNAAIGFTLEARKDERSTAERIATPLRNDGWTVISMLNLDRQSRRLPYFVPVEIQTGAGAQDVARVWFVIRPVQTKTPR